MDFLTTSIGPRIQSLTQSIYFAMWESELKPVENKYKYDLSHLELEEKLDLGLMDFHYQILTLHMSFNFTDVMRNDPNPILVYQRSIDKLKVHVIEEFLNQLMEDIRNGQKDIDTVWENRVDRIKEFGSDRGVLLKDSDIDDIWEQVFQTM